MVLVLPWGAFAGGHASAHGAVPVQVVVDGQAQAANPAPAEMVSATVVRRCRGAALVGSPCMPHAMPPLDDADCAPRFAAACRWPVAQDTRHRGITPEVILDPPIAV